MLLSDILSPDRILVDREKLLVPDKPSALKLLAKLLADAVGVSASDLETLLAERERLQSTGIGDSVAIPHASVETAPGQAAALLVCPQGVEFEAMDNQPVSIIFGVVGPRRATGDHLKALARISRLLRNARTRAELLAAELPEHVFSTIVRDETVTG